MAKNKNKNKRRRPNTPATRWGVGDTAGAFAPRVIQCPKKVANKKAARGRVRDWD